MLKVNDLFELNELINKTIKIEDICDETDILKMQSSLRSSTIAIIGHLVLILSLHYSMNNFLLFYMSLVQKRQICKRSR
jgi:hypothetical protein